MCNIIMYRSSRINLSRITSLLSPQLISEEDGVYGSSTVTKTRHIMRAAEDKNGAVNQEKRWNWGSRKLSEKWDVQNSAVIRD